MNEENHWNDIAGRYEDEIFDVFRSDKKQKLTYYFDKHAGVHRDAIDFGCGVGKAFWYLSPRFRSVLATDISAECIGVARKKGFHNITYKRADLSRKGISFPPADFGFCCNVVMLPEIERNEIMFRNIQRALKPGASAIFVLPSFESIVFSSWRLIDWYRKEGTTIDKVPDSEFRYYKGSKKDWIRGIVHIDGVPTKHYSECELQVVIAGAGFDITALEKIEYDWSTEFDEPPAWMKEPYPWDWLVEVRKPG